MNTVITDEGDELNFLVVKEDNRIEMDEATRNYLLDACDFLYKHDFAFLQSTNGYILWYHELDSNQLLQLEGALKIKDL
jgi:hypothetical protein